ncbi:MAG: NRDE family protein [Flavobacteriales bacterium]
MCLVALAYKAHARFPLVVAANRDEFLHREAAPVHFWPDQPVILAGRDLRAMGTWLGISRLGRFAAVTNHRDLRRPVVQGPSRGWLVRDALLADPGLDEQPREGYHLFHGPVDRLRYRSNVTGQDHALAEGVHALSNAPLGTPWPKVRRAEEGLRRLLASDDPSVEGFFELLADERTASAAELPDTGLEPALERALSAIRIRMPGYGTRCSTVVLVDRRGHVRFEERDMASGKAVVAEFDL